MNRSALFVTGRNRHKSKNQRMKKVIEVVKTQKAIIIRTKIYFYQRIFLINPIILTCEQLAEDDLNLCNLSLKFISTVKWYDRVNK